MRRLAEFLLILLFVLALSSIPGSGGRAGQAAESLSFLNFREAVPVGSDVTVEIVPESLTVRFDSVAVPGSIFADVDSTDICEAPPNVTFFGHYYNLSTTAELEYVTTFTMLQAGPLPPGVLERRVRIFKRPSGDCTVWRDITVRGFELVEPPTLGPLRTNSREQSEDDECSVFVLGQDNRAPLDIVDLKFDYLDSVIINYPDSFPALTYSYMTGLMDDARTAYGNGLNTLAALLVGAIADTVRADTSIPHSYKPGTGRINVAGRVIARAHTLIFSLRSLLRLSALHHSPLAPGTSDTVTVTVTVSSDYNFDYGYVYYSTDGGFSFLSSALSAVDDTMASGNIGPFPMDHTIVDYYVEVYDSAGGFAVMPDSGTYRFLVGEDTIYDIQSSLGGDGDSSAYAGQLVNVSGIVTSGSGEYNVYKFYIQNSYQDNAPPVPDFGGIKVYDPTGAVSVNRGDSVTVSGIVGEYYNETEIAMPFPWMVAVHSTGNAVPEEYLVSSEQVADEQWEGVLLGVSEAEIVDDDIGYGRWLISSSGARADSCTVDDDAGYSYVPVLGDTVNVRGIVGYAFGEYTLEPRDDNDIQDPGMTWIDRPAGSPAGLRLAIAPNPLVSSAAVRFALSSSGSISLRVYDVRGRLVRTLADGLSDRGEQTALWDLADGRGDRVTAGIYFFRLETGEGTVTAKAVVSR